MLFKRRLPVLLFTLPVLRTASAQSDTKTEGTAEEHDRAASFTWADVDGDARLDLAAVSVDGRLQLLASAGEDRFEDVTELVGLGGISNAALALWADYDGDLRLDLFVGAREGASQLFHNEGGAFVDMSAASGLTVEGAVRSAHWLDHDGDGRLDLHVVTADRNVSFRGLEGGFFEAIEMPPASPRILHPTGESSPSRGSMAPSSAAVDTASDVRGAVDGMSTERSPGTSAASGGGTLGGSGTVAATASPTCVASIEDRSNPGTCLFASTTPTLGRLLPISASLFVTVGGNVGIGTTSPVGKLDVTGTARVADTLTLAAPGDQAVDVSTGSIYKGGALFIHTKGGAFNTALGREALSSVTTGFSNLASGYKALFSNEDSFNTASGYRALYANTLGGGNTAVGARAHLSNAGGFANTASGTNALSSNTNGYRNTGFGNRALASNTSGARNTAVGYQGLVSNTTGFGNTACGFQALRANTSGDQNIHIGFETSYRTTGDRNIDIGNRGVAGESSTTRIGTSFPFCCSTHIAGIFGITTGMADAIPVLIDLGGQLGTVSSSRRFKEEIRDMGDLTERLLELRPVVFRYKPEVQQGERSLEYGLIAEEVAEVFPELVVLDGDGRPFTVKYHVLASMLLNELEKLHSTVERQEALDERELSELRERLEARTAELEDMRYGLARLNELEMRLGALQPASLDR